MVLMGQCAEDVNPNAIEQTQRWNFAIILVQDKTRKATVFERYSSWMNEFQNKINGWDVLKLSFEWIFMSIYWSVLSQVCVAHAVSLQRTKDKR